MLNVNLALSLIYSQSRLGCPPGMLAHQTSVGCTPSAEVKPFGLLTDS
jgi:hypothetical protein